jgi:putative ABC transport system permease protein
VTGAYRSSLVLQFLLESELIAIFAGVISLGAVYFALPFFNVLIKQQLSLNVGSSSFWLTAAGLIIVVGLLAGAYPAFYLSSFRPVRILKGANISASNRSWSRTMLVTLQFGFAMILVVSTMVVNKQIRHVQERETGYSKDNLVYQFLTGDLPKNYASYKNELLQSGVALSVSKSTTPITEKFSGTTEMKWRGKDPNDKTDIERFHIDDEFVTTARLTIIEGRDLDLQKFPSDSSAALLNETALAVMGFKDPIGEIVNDDGRQYRVVGVIKDFIFTSPNQKVEPIVLMFGKKEWFNIINIKLNSANEMHQNLSTLSALYSKYNPAFPFEYHFVDVEYARKFANLQTTLTITTLFASIAIFIACLGLLGLSTYMIELRIKEIGIRKVMGGSVLNITKLLSMSSLKPIALGIIIFAPMGWFAMQWWLNTFAYRISLNVWMLFMAALSILFIALLTIGAQTLRAANENPVKSLKNE